MEWSHLLRSFTCCKISGATMLNMRSKRIIIMAHNLPFFASQKYTQFRAESRKKSHASTLSIFALDVIAEEYSNWYTMWMGPLNSNKTSQIYYYYILRKMRGKNCNLKYKKGKHSIRRKCDEPERVEKFISFRGSHMHAIRLSVGRSAIQYQFQFKGKN